MKTTLALCLLLGLCACQSGGPHSDNSPSNRSNRYIAVDSPAHIGVVGVESQDIVSMTDKMVRDMLASPALVDPKKPTVIIVDDEYFRNESHQRLNKGLIVDRLRTELLRASQGRFRFIARHAAAMVKAERDKRRQGEVAGAAAKQLSSADFRLSGRFMDLPQADDRGRRTNYVQVQFEMIELNSGELVWAHMYEFKKSGREGIMYQ